VTSPVATEFGPYSSAQPFFGAVPNWIIDTDDKDRLRAYEVYNKMYWTEPGSFALQKRGEDTREVQIPSFRKMVEATNQFLCVDFDYVLDPSTGTDADRKRYKEFLDKLFSRENFWGTRASVKRNMLKLGDGFTHITADDTKEAGKRISIEEVQAENVFWIYNGEAKVGVHLAEKIKDPRDADGIKRIIKRQTYRKQFSEPDENGARELTGITSETDYFELDAWDDRNLEPGELKRVIHKDLSPKPEQILEDIMAIPVYHYDNIKWGRHPYGISEMRGMESAISAVNQSLTDEDLTLVMQGLGVYWTNAGPPEDAEGNETSLEIGPGVVLEVPDGNSVGRLNGVSSVAPMIEHMRFILEEGGAALGVSGAAAGKVDVQVAESGISLYLQLGPMIAKNAEKELNVLGKDNQFGFDLLNYWMPAYEEGWGNPGEAPVTIKFIVGDPIPVNRVAVYEEVIALTDANLILIDMAVDTLSRKLGYEYPANAAELLLEQQKKRTAAATPVDPFADRAAQEQGAPEDDEDPEAD
jgi:hypothetical protein